MYMSRESSVPNFLNKKNNSDHKYIRKQTLGEIKNVIHNQVPYTPFKGVRPCPSRSVCSDSLISGAKNEVDSHRRFSGSQAIKHGEGNISEVLTVRRFETCTRECLKSLEEIWSEINVLKDDVLRNILNGCMVPEKNQIDITNESFQTLRSEDLHILNSYQLESQELMKNALKKDLDLFRFPVIAVRMDDQ